MTLRLLPESRQPREAIDNNRQHCPESGLDRGGRAALRECRHGLKTAFSVTGHFAGHRFGGSSGDSFVCNRIFRQETPLCGPYSWLTINVDHVQNTFNYHVKCSHNDLTTRVDFSANACAIEGYDILRHSPLIHNRPCESVAARDIRIILLLSSQEPAEGGCLAHRKGQGYGRSSSRESGAGR